MFEVLHGDMAHLYGPVVCLTHKISDMRSISSAVFEDSATFM